MEDIKTSPKQFLELFEQWGKVITVTIAMLLVMSICYDYAYLRAIGLSFNEVPSSTAEHLRSALLWVPYLVLVATGYLFYEILMRRMENGRSEEEIMSSISPRARAFRKSGAKAPLVALILVTITSPLFSTDFGWVYLLFMLGWMVLAVSVITHKKMRTGFNLTSAACFAFIPFFLAYIAFLGHTDGGKMLNAKRPTWEIVLKAGSTTNKQLLIGIRRFATFAVIIDQTRSVSLIPNDAILSAKKLDLLPPSEMNICRWFALDCLAKTETQSVNAAIGKP